jgi:hypothetical protein
MTGNDNQFGPATPLKGLVVPVDWDEDGQVTAVAISAHDEKEYRVEPDGAAAGLFELIREEVEVTGRVKQTLQGDLRMVIEAFQIAG